MNTMPNQQGHALQLRDIHLPEPVSWWPVAPGWWMVLAVTVLLLAIVIFCVRRYQQRRYRRIGLQQLSLLEGDVNLQQDQRQLIQQLSQLLRHLAVLHYGQSCAGLEGEAWLAFLDQPFQKKTAPENKPFSVGVGQCLGFGPYQKIIAEIDVAALLPLCRLWIKKLPLAAKQRGAK